MQLNTEVRNAQSGQRLVVLYRLTSGCGKAERHAACHHIQITCATGIIACRSHWLLGLRRGSEATCLLRLWVRILPGAWMSVYCECCVLSGRGLCDGLITRPEESYRLWCVAECDLQTSWMRRPWPTAGLLRQKQNKTNKTVTLV